MSQNKEIMIRYMIGDTEVKLTPAIVQEYILGSNSGKITLPEFKFFCEMARSRGLNPFTREIFALKYGNSPITIIVSKQAILKRATTHPKFNGLLSGIFVKNSEGKIEKRDGGILLDDEILVGSWCEVFRKDWDKPMYCSCSMNEINQEKNPSWKKMPVTMAIKTATVRACRDAFPEDLGGLYVQDEIGDTINKQSSGFTVDDLDVNESESNIDFDGETEESKESTQTITMEDL